MPFAELSVTSNFTFLTGASHPEEMMRRAAELGLPALAIADENSVAGIVRAYISRTSDFLPRPPATAKRACQNDKRRPSATSTV
jgi:DNA polymerase III alpha subunit